MKQSAILALLVFLSTSLFAQFQASSRKVHFQAPTAPHSSGGQLNKKSPSTLQQCGPDTLEYARYKASGLVGISIQQGYALGQFFEAPVEITVSGFNFYAWGLMNNNDSVAVYCQLFAASSDSLPTGNPIRSDTIYVDSSFGGGVLANLVKRAGWVPYKTKDPFVMVVSSSDSERVAIVTNDYSRGDGDREGLASGSVAGTWYNALNLNISGMPLDCDIAIEPYVEYQIFNDFSFKNCYNYQDTVKFINESSPILFSRMYNRYEFFNLGRFCHRWDFGSGFYQYGQTQDAFIVYPSPQNQSVTMISNMIQYRGNSQCYDTTVKELHFQPNPIKFLGIPSTICEGDSIWISSGSNGEVKWFRQPFDTQAFHIGVTYQTPPLYQNDTAYVRAYNEGCTSLIARLELQVNDKPEITSVLNDSICNNSIANLAAYCDAGTIRWYADSISPTVLHQGNILQIGPLTSDTALYARAYNMGCFSDGRVRVRALVSNDFAPAEPLISGDTTICLLSGPLTLRAMAADTLRWFNVPSGGTPIQLGDSFVFTPNAKGIQKVFVDAFNGTCASSRLSINIQVDHFSTITDYSDATCFGNTLVVDYNPFEGGISWYDSDSNFLGDATYWSVSEPGNHTYYLEPYMGNCRDSIWHTVNLNVKPLPVIKVAENDGACRGLEGMVTLQDNGGTYDWYYNGEKVKSGLSLTTPPLYLNRSYEIHASKDNCTSDTVISVLVLKTPNANFDYQVAWRNAEFTARDLTLASYAWDVDDEGKTYSVPEFTHYYKQDGDYKVTLIGTGENGCRDTVFKPVTINTVSVDELPYGMSLSPNPSNGLFALVLPSAPLHLTIRVTDVSGKEIHARVSGTDASFTIDISAYPAGTYFVYLVSDDGTCHARLVHAGSR